MILNATIRGLVFLTTTLLLSSLAIAGTEPAVNQTPTLGAPQGTPMSGDELDAATEKLAKVIRCPVCQGQSINDSSAELAQNMRRQARDLLGAGYTDEQILMYFETAYGEFIRFKPKSEGFNLVVWLLPLIGFGFGLLVFAYLVGRWAKPISEEVEIDPELLPYLERVRVEVAEGANT